MVTVSISSPSGEGGGRAIYINGSSIAAKKVSISSPSGEGGGLCLLLVLVPVPLVSISSPSGEGGGQSKKCQALAGAKTLQGFH